MIVSQWHNSYTYNKRQKGLDTFPFKESRTNPSPKVLPSNPLPPQTMLFSYHQLFLFPLPTLKGGGGRRGGGARGKCNVKVIFPQLLSSQLSVSTMFVAYCSYDNLLAISPFRCRCLIWVRTRATLVGGECSHHCAMPAPRKERK